MLEILGFIGIFFVTFMVREFYKYFMLFCLALFGCGILFEIEALCTFSLTVLFVSLICLLSINNGNSSGGTIPDRGVSSSDLHGD
ncbi:MAG: hypothetical protein IJV07_01650 [Alphaproteobacteria bacterium]|nr:hypothetical protein [Alphaproteobacteria bacterium]